VLFYNFSRSSFFVFIRIIVFGTLVVHLSILVNQTTMDFGNDNMTEPLNESSAGGAAVAAAAVAAGDDDDAASQSSQRSGASLLERIRAQRQREAQQKQQQQQGGNVSGSSENRDVNNNTTPSTIQVPQYNPASSSQENDQFGRSGSGDFGQHSAPGSGSFFTDAWNTISTSMETGMASLHQENADDDDVGGLDASDALLAPSDRHHQDGEEENYSIARYFMTFVNDVNGSFLNLPVWVRVIIIFAMLYSAFKLL
jgi:type II secretory pathway pseudopilin PulG